MEILQSLAPNLLEIGDEFLQAAWETLYMTLLTCLIGFTIGTFVGLLAVLTMPGGLWENKAIYKILDQVINIFRSIPFVILIALLVGVTRFIVGTSIGTMASIVPLVVSTIPFFARQVQNSLLEIDPGVIEAAESMGLSTREIIFRVYLVEGLPSLIRVSALTIISVIGLTAMAGIIGGGGLGNLAITRGYNRYQTDITIACTIAIILMVFLFQWLADLLLKKIDHQNG